MLDMATIWLTAYSVRMEPSNRKQEIAPALPVEKATLQRRRDPFIVVSVINDTPGGAVFRCQCNAFF